MPHELLLRLLTTLAETPGMEVLLSSAETGEGDSGSISRLFFLFSLILDLVLISIQNFFLKS